MIEDMKLRNFAPKTVALYVDNVARFAGHFGKSPELLGHEQVRQYLVHLVEERKLAWGTYNQALAALRYLYRWVLKRGEVVADIRGPKRVRHLPVVLSLEEVSHFFAAVVSYKHRMALMTAYSAGLRISEVVNLQIKDIDSARMLIHVREGKRGKDRYTVLLAGAVGHAAPLLLGRPSGQLPVPRAVAGQADQRQPSAAFMQGGAGQGGNRKGDLAAHVSPQLRNAPAGGRH